MNTRGSTAAGVVLVLMTALQGCGGMATEGTTTVLVSAAASLTDAFEDIEHAFEAVHSDIDVVLNLAGSSALREQILEGAPADVFAPANTSNMDQVVETGSVDGEPVVFARNLLQIAVPPGNPAGVEDLADFTRDELLLGLCAEGVPCGDFAREVLAKAGVTAAIDTNEPDVRALLTKIELGELDAGITYMTDVASTDGGVEGVDIPEDDNVDAAYPIAVLARASDQAAARAFVDFVLSDDGGEILNSKGFETP